MKLGFFNAAVLSIFLYGSETWLLTTRMISKIDSFGAACLRIILNLRRSANFHDHSETYKAAGLSPLSHYVKARRLSFVGHQLRLDEQELARRYALYEPPPSLGLRKRGRQAHTFKHQIVADITTNPNDLTTAQLTAAAKDRTGWKKRVSAWTFLSISFE